LRNIQADEASEFQEFNMSNQVVELHEEFQPAN
jgi:hypothetical protein